MHLYLRIALLMAIALMANCSEDLETRREGKGLSTVPIVPIEVKEISQGYATLRDGRRIKSKKGARLNFGILDGLLDIIDFESGNCTGTGGSCMSQKDCTNMNGTDSDTRCVQGFGVCCVTGDSEVYEGGDVTIRAGGGDFFNPAADGSRPVRPIVSGGNPTDVSYLYTATLEPPTDAVQVKITIVSLNIAGPEEGDCGNDTLVIKGANPGLEIPTLCGVASDQTLYIDIDNSEGPFEIVTKIGCCIDAPAEWDIDVDYLTEADAVPRRCLQYHTATEGTIQSFNYRLDPPGMMLNEQTYSICFGYVVGYCDIAFNVERFDLGLLGGECTNDYVLVGHEKRCGDVIDGSITANATGPIIIGVRSDSVNEREEEGFSATYTMLGCV